MPRRSGDAARGRAGGDGRARPAARRDIAAIGITNQRETTVLWDRATGKPVAQRHRLAGPPHRRPLRRTARARTRAAVPQKTGLVLDPYFSGTKLRGCSTTCRARARAPSAASCAFGTIDCWLVWNLTGGAHARHRRHQRLAHAAVRHHTRRLGRRAAGAPRHPARVLPEVRAVQRRRRRDRAAPARRGAADRRHRRRPAGGALRPAASTPGMAKNTYGTGCFMLMNTGASAVASRNRLLTTIAWRGLPGRPHLSTPRRQRLRRRRRRAVAARRPGDHPDGAGDRALAAQVRRHRRRLPRARLRRPRRAALGRLRARHDRRAHARHHARPPRARRARGDRLQTVDVLAAMARDSGIALTRAARRRRRLAQRPADADAGRLPRHPGRAAAGDRDHRARRRLPGRPGRRLLAATPARSPRQWQVDRRFEPAMDEGRAAAKLARWRHAVDGASAPALEQG